MTLTVPLDAEIGRQLDAVCKRRRTIKSAVVSDPVHEFIAREPAASSYAIAARLGVIGCDMSRPGPVAANAKAAFRHAIGAKHRR